MFLHLSLKLIKYQFQESLQEIGCTVPFFKNKDHICNDTEKAEQALEFYKLIFTGNTFLYFFKFGFNIIKALIKFFKFFFKNAHFSMNIVK